VQFLCLILQVYLIICVVRIVTSWLELDRQGGILGSAATLSYAVTEPIFATVRRALPLPGDIPIDISPMVVILLLTFLRGLIC